MFSIILLTSRPNNNDFCGFIRSAGQFYDESYFELYRVHVSHTGRMKWWFGGVMETSCHIDGELFPFDSQSCKFIVQSWAYSEAYVDLRNATNIVELERFNDDGILSWYMTYTTYIYRLLCFLNASLYVSKRGAYWDRLCRDVVGRWLVGWLSRACTVAKRCILGL